MSTTERDARTTLCRRHRRTDDRRLSTAIVEAVATASDRPPTAPGFVLSDAVDPEALDALFAAGGEWSFEFRLEQWTVTVTHEGAIDVRKTDG